MIHIKSILNSQNVTDFIEKSREWLSNNKYIITETFGAIKYSDMQKYKFLQNDNGVPYKLKEQQEIQKITYTDALGNVKTKKEHKTIEKLYPIDEFINWKSNK